MWPERFSIEYDGDKVSSVKIKWGFENRPLWETLKKMSPQVAVKWVDRFSALESLPCEWAMARCFERAYRVPVPLRAEFLRTIHCEIQRLIWGFDYIAGIFDALNDQIRKEQALFLREIMFDAQELFCGARILPHIFCVGGVERDLSLGESRKLKSIIVSVEKDFNHFFSSLGDDIYLQERLQSIIPISQENIRRLSWTGAVAQSCGLNWDLRVMKSYGAYQNVNIQYFNPIKRDEVSNAYNRLLAVVFQIRQSFTIIPQLVDSIANGETKVEIKDFGPIPEGFWTSSIEAASGPIHAIIEREQIRISSISVRLVPFLETILCSVNREDFMVGLKSLGFNFSEGDLV